MDEMQFIEFEGDESEVEFLKKCYKQWEITINGSDDKTLQLLSLGGVFSEIEHRIEELEEEQNN